MAKISFSQSAIDYLKRRGIIDKVLLLITDDAGGKFSINGGSCSMGMHYSLIWLDHPDSDYPEKLTNKEKVRIYTSSYDLTMLGDNLVIYYRNAALNLKNDSGLLDGGMEIGNGKKLLAANFNVKQDIIKSC